MIPGVPQEIPEWVRSVRDARHWLACEYQRDGFTVVEDPTPGDLPAAVLDFHLDLFAHKPGLNVAAVIRRRNDISENNLLLARTLQGASDWRLDMIVLPNSLIEVARNLPASDLAKAP